MQLQQYHRDAIAMMGWIDWIDIIDRIVCLVKSRESRFFIVVEREGLVGLILEDVD